MARENKRDKALRYLGEGRIVVTRAGDKAHPGLIVAEARGTDRVYLLGYDPEKRQWRCTCEANSKFHRSCAHLEALKLVTRIGG